MLVTIDSSVWIAAAEPGDKFHAESRAFVRQVIRNGDLVYVPAFARIEIACALSRRWRDAVAGQAAATFGLMVLKAIEVPVDAVLLDEAYRTGCDKFLRGADAVFAATAVVTGSTLVSWMRSTLHELGPLLPPIILLQIHRFRPRREAILLDCNHSAWQLQIWL